MNKKRIGIFIALVAVVCLGLNAQRATSLKINEVLVTNEQNYQDDYGLHNAWIEIFNTSFATVNIEGCYLTNDKNNPTKYPIPKGDVLTQIKPRQHALFWADGMPNRGTFHVNFTLDPNKENYIALYDSNGKTLIDEVTIPAGMLADQSYARQEDGSANWVIKGGGEHSYVTPSTNNMTQDKNEKIENFKKHDEDGFGMAIIAMSVVFIGLILLYVSFKIVGNIAVKLGKKNAMKATGITDKVEAKEKNLGSHSGEEAAAIAMALHEFMNDAHDVEDMILTINKVKRTYSPWSSKIYTLRQTPKR
ncbi:OadG family transporter subunit [Bacteroides sp.]|uniref:OadG family transporter subunit n=1 Tax=Bacteroides sp. TaxID=29523 RepID=UPI0025BB28F1|nr:OadG family transporter subunit [Bacteroides sp.]